MQKIVLACDTEPALDLACGTGRNGLTLLASGIPVVFADRDSASLQQIHRHLAALPNKPQKELSRIWQIDLENPAQFRRYRARPASGQQRAIAQLVAEKPDTFL